MIFDLNMQANALFQQLKVLMEILMNDLLVHRNRPPIDVSKFSPLKMKTVVYTIFYNTLFIKFSKLQIKMRDIP